MPSLNVFRTFTRVGMLGACALTSVVHAQVLTPLVGAPLPPTDLRPLAGDYEGRKGNLTVLTMGWSQFFPSGPGLYVHPTATNFIVCVDAYTNAAPPPCKLATANHYTESIAAPTPALVRSGNSFTFMPGRFISGAELDKPLRLTVLACSVLVDRSCAATGVDLFYSSRNIVADGASVAWASTNTDWTFDARAMNPGDSDVPKFDGSIELFEVVGFGYPGRDCETNVDSPDFVNDESLVIIGTDGSRTQMTLAKRTKGAYSGPQVAGIYRMGDFRQSIAFTTTNPAIAANNTSSAAVKTVTFPIPVGATPRTFVAIESLDTGNVIREFNENDNVKAKCRVR